MRRISFILIWSMVLPIVSGLANPPVSISLSYDLAKRSLRVDAVHPTSDLEKNYVRLMKIYVNGSEVSNLNYFRQNDYDEFTDDVSVTAKVGDVIKVDLFCQGGGELAQELKVKE